MLRQAYWTREKLRNHQAEGLRRILQFAYDTVPFYREKFRSLGIKPRDIRTLDDINKLPIIQKDEMRKNPEKLISKQFNIDKLRTFYTTGSTGRPFRVAITQHEDVIRKVKHLRANVSCGQRPRDRWAAITSPSHFAEAPRLLHMFGVYTTHFVSLFDRIDRQISLIEKIKPDVIGGYSNSLLLLAKEVKKRGMNTIRPRLIFGGAELSDDLSRRFIEEVFNAPFYDQYAIVELERIAWQCPERSGYHIDDDMIITQFVDRNGEEVSENESGEMVCTSLINHAMPFIRYAVGDLGVPSGEKCPCGRTLPLMKLIEGRKGSMLVLPGCCVLAPITMTIIMMTFKLNKYIDQFRVVQKKTDLIEIQLKMKDRGFDGGTIESELIKHVKRSLGIGTDDFIFETRFVDDMPLDRTGKYNLVISELKQHVN